MPETTFHGRRAVTIENDRLRLTVLREGGHIAEILEKTSGVNPLWIPPWPSTEPSQYRDGDAQYGSGAEARLLAGIMGHNLCLDLFGGPSPEEAAAGMTVHGEGSIAPYEITECEGGMTLRADLPRAQIRFERAIQLAAGAVEIRETVENQSCCDRPIAWTQHVTLGPPFLDCGVTVFRLTATRSKVFESDFGTADYLKPGAEFDWPIAPRSDGGLADLRLFTTAEVSSAFTTHLMDPDRETASFAALHPGLGLAFGYVWKQSDFPWTGIWEENLSRANPPWNGKTLARGMEFGASPIPESRRAMIDRGSLFGVPGYRWLPARGRLEARYRAFALPAKSWSDLPVI